MKTLTTTLLTDQVLAETEGLFYGIESSVIHTHSLFAFIESIILFEYVYIDAIDHTHSKMLNSKLTIMPHDKCHIKDKT